MVDDRLALGPLGAGIEVLGEVVIDDNGITRALDDSPVGVDDGAHEALNLLKGSASELVVVASNPGGVGVGVDSLDVSGEIDGLLLAEEVKDVAILAESDPLAGGLGLGKVDKLSLFSESVDTVLELGELLVEVVKLNVTALGGVLNSGLAELADVVVLSEEVVDTASAGNSSESSESESAHSVYWLIRFKNYNSKQRT